MRGLDYYLPAMAMLFIQFIYAGMSLGTRTVLLQGMSPRVFIVYRQVFATIVLAPVAYFSGRMSGSYSLNLRSFSLIFLTSLIGITLNQNLYFEGLYLASASIASAMANLVPALTFVIAAFTGMERVNIRSLRTLAKIVGTVICISGAASIALLKGPKLLNAENLPSKSIMGSEGQNWLLGILFIFGSNCAWALWLILQVPASASHPDHLSFGFWMCLMATLQSAAVTVFLEPDPNAWKINSLLEFGCSLYAGVMGSSVLISLQAWCISQRGPLFSAMFNPLFTVIVTVLAALLLHEEIYIGSLIGAIGVIIGLYVVLWGKAEEVVKAKDERDPKSMVNTTEEGKVLINESSEKAYCKTDLEEPLLSAKSSSHY
ncbi:WAT1-related protein At4g30420 [Gastrolobium bilobum]|uniref:WAT1-related protein At4g30420 n=1 Tax=Gastrolobium bilobum TaxID=150636 RepID=UPI002AB194D1|nr:WAT1-related protein At4g30420 [Gastrolobium bilobum]